MTDGPARPMTGIKGAGFPGTAQVDKPLQLILNQKLTQSTQIFITELFFSFWLFSIIFELLISK